jgi:hypothetical protein
LAVCRTTASSSQLVSWWVSICTLEGVEFDPLTVAERFETSSMNRTVVNQAALAETLAAY